MILKAQTHPKLKRIVYHELTCFWRTWAPTRCVFIPADQTRFSFHCEGFCEKTSAEAAAWRLPVKPQVHLGQPATSPSGLVTGFPSIIWVRGSACVSAWKRKRKKVEGIWERIRMYAWMCAHLYALCMFWVCVHQWVRVCERISWC